MSPSESFEVEIGNKIFTLNCLRKVLALEPNVLTALISEDFAEDKCVIYVQRNNIDTELCS